MKPVQVFLVEDGRFPVFDGLPDVHRVPAVLLRAFRVELIAFEELLPELCVELEGLFLGLSESSVRVEVGEEKCTAFIGKVFKVLLEYLKEIVQVLRILQSFTCWLMMDVLPSTVSCLIFVYIHFTIH